MLVDGKVIASSILDEVQKKVEGLSKPPCMAVLTCAPNFETQKYLSMKKKTAAKVGISLRIAELPTEATTEDVITCMSQVAKDADGLVVQLPLPNQIDKEAVLKAIPQTKDPDGFWYESGNKQILPPVVGAIDEISRLHNVKWEGQKVVILGEGKLVGAPAAVYARSKGAEVNVLNKETFSTEVLKKADIVVSGIGVPQMIKAEMLKKDVVIFDAGTSEDGGELRGDVDPGAEGVAALLTPVPGGIGPVTIAYLLRNVTALAAR